MRLFKIIYNFEDKVLDEVRSYPVSNLINADLFNDRYKDRHLFFQPMIGFLHTESHHKVMNHYKFLKLHAGLELAVLL